MQRPDLQNVKHLSPIVKFRVSVGGQKGGSGSQRIESRRKQHATSQRKEEKEVTRVMPERNDSNEQENNLSERNKLASQK